MKWSEKCYFLFARSTEVILPEKLDFVYIDANHNYECVKEDIEHWYPKVKVGGIIAGHDFHYKTVHTAVLEKFPKVMYDQMGDCWVYEKVS